MLGFSHYNPIAVTLYYLAVTLPILFSMDPILFSLSLTGSILCFVIQNPVGQSGTHWFSLGLFMLISLLNPLFSHSGATVLFVFNQNPVTLEAFWYGMCTAAMLLAVLYWFSSYSKLMTSDKLLYLFGKLSPRLALILSMALRYVPLFQIQTKKVRQTQKSLGLYEEDNLIDRFRGGIQVFSVMITWALENGILTADSMAARGYGIGKRTHFAPFRFRISDTILTIISLPCMGLTLWGTLPTPFIFYPVLTPPPFTLSRIIGYFAYGLLVLIPTLIEAKEVFQWRCLRSKI